MTSDSKTTADGQTTVAEQNSFRQGWENATLTAQWTKDTYTAAFDYATNGGQRIDVKASPYTNASGTYVLTGDYGTEFKFQEYLGVKTVPCDYSFNGWNTSSAATSGKLTGTVRIWEEALSVLGTPTTWTQKSYSIGALVKYKDNACYRAVRTTSTVPGIVYKGGTRYVSDWEKVTSVTYYATYKNSFNVTFIEYDVPEDYSSGTEYSVCSVVKYDGKLWRAASNTSEAPGGSAWTELTGYASTARIAPTRTVTEVNVFNDQATYQLSSMPSIKGCDIDNRTWIGAGWTTDANKDTAEYRPGTTLAAPVAIYSDRTFFAVYHKKFTVTFDGGTPADDPDQPEGVPEDVELERKVKVTDPDPYYPPYTPGTPTRNGYDFTGWTDPDHPDPTTGTLQPKDDVTYTANWEGVKSTLQVYPAGNFAGPVSYGGLIYVESYVKGEHKDYKGQYDGAEKKAYAQARELANHPHVLTLTPPEVFGYTFKRWIPSASMKGTWQEDESRYYFGPVKNAVDSLTAEWEPKSYTIIYRGKDPNDPGDIDIEITCNPGEAPADLAYDAAKSWFRDSAVYGDLDGSTGAFTVPGQEIFSEESGAPFLYWEDELGNRFDPGDVVRMKEYFAEKLDGREPRNDTIILTARWQKAGVEAEVHKELLTDGWHQLTTDTATCGAFQNVRTNDNVGAVSGTALYGVEEVTMTFGDGTLHIGSKGRDIDKAISFEDLIYANEEGTVPLFRLRYESGRLGEHHRPADCTLTDRDSMDPVYYGSVHQDLGFENVIVDVERHFVTNGAKGVTGNIIKFTYDTSKGAIPAEWNFGFRFETGFRRSKIEGYEVCTYDKDKPAEENDYIDIPVTVAAKKGTFTKTIERTIRIFNVRTADFIPRTHSVIVQN